jgi:hypothetical protein
LSAFIRSVGDADACHRNRIHSPMGDRGVALTIRLCLQHWSGWRRPLLRAPMPALFAGKSCIDATGPGGCRRVRAMLLESLSQFDSREYERATIEPYLLPSG